MQDYKIRDNIPQYIEELKAWLVTQETVPLEEMSDFFTQRISDYEDHMMLWQEGYRHLAKLIPDKCRSMLDLGCGTGLELDEILAQRPDIQVTGIDLCEAMLNKLGEKHPQVMLRREDYFEAELGSEQYDCVISFESLHHFVPEKKQQLFEKIHKALKPGGVYLEVDYLAACQEEEQMLMEFCRKKRAEAGISPDLFVHFDTPLTVEHELELMNNAGFTETKWLCCIEGASFVRCVK